MSGDKFRVGLIRVLSSDDQQFIDMHGKVIMDHFPGLEITSRCIPDQWEGIHSQELFRQAVPKIVTVAKTFSDYDMILVSCADDPGVEEIRAEMPGMIVTGGGETTASLALRYGNKIGILGITDYAPRAYATRFSEKIVAVRRPHGVHNTLDLMTPEGRESCLSCAEEIRDLGAEVIALGCTGLTTIGIANEIESRVGIPVIDPVLAEGTFAYFESIRHRR